MRLIDCRDVRDNNLNILRLIAAFFVLFGHCFTLLWTTPENLHVADPISAWLRVHCGFNLGLPAIGVSLFFLISGFLVTKSFHQRGCAKNFIAARVLRIYPGLWVNVLACIALGACVTSLSQAEYWMHPATHEFFYWNGSLIKSAFLLPGVFDELPWKGGINGSLWTLPHEVRMYGWVLLLGLVGVLQQRVAFNALAILTIGLFLFKDTQFLLPGGHAKLWLFFVIGMGAYLNASFIPMRWSLLLLATIFMLLVAQFAPAMAYNMVFALWLSYVIFMLGYRHYLPMLNIGRYGDFSYGLYLYAFPVQQTLIYWLGPQMNPWLFVMYTTLVTAPLAMLSWYLVEKPGLNLRRIIFKKQDAS